MKTILVTALALAAIASGPSIAGRPSIAPAPWASTHSGVARAVTVRHVDYGLGEINRGTPSQTVLNNCGSPDHRITEDVWVYHRFYAKTDRPEIGDCTSLVVTIREGEVADLHLVNEKAEAILVADTRALDRLPAFLAGQPDAPGPPR